jgi:putative ABC transport system permease protein
MRSVMRVILAGLRHHVASVVLVAVVVALGTAGLSSAFIVRDDASARLDRAFAADHGPDLVVTADASRSAEIERSLQSDPSVDAVGTPRVITQVESPLGGDVVSIELNGLGSHPGRGDELNVPVVTKGRLPRSATEITIDAGIADDKGIELGDSLVLRSDHSRQTLTVVGFGYDFADCFYPSCDPGRAWTYDDVVTSFDTNPQRLIAVDVAAGRDPDAVGRSLDASFPGAVSGWNSWPDTRGDFLAETKYFGAFLGVFGLFVLIASVVVIAGSVSARVLARERALAQCRTLGFTRGQTALTLIVEQLVVAFLAAIAGNAVAAVIAPRLEVGSLHLLATKHGAFSTSAAVVSVVVALIAVLVAVTVPAVRAGRRPLRAALSGAPKSLSIVGRLIERPLRVVRRPIAAVLGLRSAAGRPLRTVLGVLAVAVAITVAMVSSGIGRTMDKFIAHPELGGTPQAAMFQRPSGMSERDVAQRLAGMSEIDGWFSVVDDLATVADRSMHIRAIGGEPAGARYVIGDGKALTSPGELIAGYGVYTDMGWHIGDRVQLTIGNHSLSFTLVGWYRETDDSGEVVQIRAEDYRKVNPDVEPRYSVIASTGTTPEQVGAALTRSLGSGADVVVETIDRAGLQPFRIAMATMTVLIGLVAIAHLVSISVIAARERRRRTGVLRALGMTRRDLAVETASRAATITTLAALVGVPLGWLANRALSDMLTADIGAGPGVAAGPTAVQVATIAVIASLIGIITSVLAAVPVLRSSLTFRHQSE